MATPTAANGWLAEQTVADVLTQTVRTSAIESVARKVLMTTDVMNVPRFESTGVDVVAKAATIPLKDPVLGEATLTARKFANRFAVPVEDTRDAVANFLDQAKASWTSNFAVKLDNAALGVTAAVNGTTVPFTSVYNSVNTGAAGNIIKTAGNVTYEDVVGIFDTLETGLYGTDLVVIAHPAFKGFLRNLKDEAGVRVVDTLQTLSGSEQSIFGNRIVFSVGARTSTTATDTPTGNPLLIVGNRKHLILGVRDGVESQISDIPQWETDVVELKMRARRGFVPATASAFTIIEKTAAV